MGPRRRLTLLILVGGHLGLVGANALGADFREGPASPAIARRASEALAEYGALSGAESRYSFFAPGVDEQLRPRFEVVGASCGVRTDVLEEAVNAEVDLRVGNLVSLLWWRDEDLQRAIVASWAESMYARHPWADAIVMGVELYELPSMDAFRAGQRPAWRLLGSTSFSPPCAGDRSSEAGG